MNSSSVPGLKIGLMIPVCRGLGHLSQQEEKLPQPNSFLWPSPLTVPSVQVLDGQNLLHWEFPAKEIPSWCIPAEAARPVWEGMGIIYRRFHFAVSKLCSSSTAAGGWRSKEILEYSDLFLLNKTNPILFYLDIQI